MARNFNTSGDQARDTTFWPEAHPGNGDAFSPTRTGGTIAIRIKPNWSSGDGVAHIFWIYLDTSQNAHFMLAKWSDDVLIAGYHDAVSLDERIDVADSGHFTSGTEALWIYTWDCSTNEQFLYKDNSLVASDTVTDITLNPSPDDELTIGNNCSAFGEALADATLSEFAHWNRIISASERAILQNGKSPKILPGLIYYAPLRGIESPERDLANNNALTITGTVSATHPLADSAATGTGFFVGDAASFVGEAFVGANAGATTFNESVSEAATAADTVTSTAVLNSSVAESATATDTPSATGIFPSAVAESASAADSEAASLTRVGSLSEAASAAETASAQANLVGAVAEAGTATDTPSSQAVLNSTVSEAGAATDTPSSSAIFGSAITESGAANDSGDATGAFGAAIVESAAAADADDAAAVFVGTIAESASATDTEDATVDAGSGNFNESITESASAADAADASVVTADAIVEAATATDATDTSAILGATLTEAASATDDTDASVSAVYDVTIEETAGATDTVTAEEPSAPGGGGPGGLFGSGGYRKRDIDEAVAARRARLALLARAETIPTPEKKAVLERAATVARKALASAPIDELLELTRKMRQAAQAPTTASAVAIAREVIAQAAALQDDEDEELLLLAG